MRDTDMFGEPLTDAELMAQHELDMAADRKRNEKNPYSIHDDIIASVKELARNLKRLKEYGEACPGNGGVVSMHNSFQIQRANADREIEFGIWNDVVMMVTRKELHKRQGTQLTIDLQNKAV